MSSSFSDFTKNRIDLQAVGYEQDGTISSYTIDDGLVIIPIQGPIGTSPVVARIHAPFTTRTTSGSAVKKNAPPLIPAPANTATGHIFIGGSIDLPAPNVTGTPQQLYGVKYTYNFLVPTHIKIAGAGKLLFDSHPYMSGVDILGNIPPDVNPANNTDANAKMGYMWNTWTGAFFDLEKFTTNRMLG